ncbi:MAG: zinc ribbon domain-containing protein [Planctomycetota bacterium]
MSGQEPEKTVCCQCSGPLEAGALLCPRCGTPADGPVVYHSKPRQDWAESRAMVLFLLFAVLGPLALPVLWRSSKFSRTWKIVLTTLAVIQTAAVVWLLWYVIHWFVEYLRDHGNLRGGR